MPAVRLCPPLEKTADYPNGGSEADWMGQICAHMKTLLEVRGVCCMAAQNEAPAQSAALHLVLCSNMAPVEEEGMRKGAAFCYATEHAESRRAAKLLAENYREIYPEPALVLAVPCALPSSLGEPPLVVVKTAFRDNPQDEIWLTGNLRDIAGNLAEGVCRFFRLGEKNA